MKDERCRNWTFVVYDDSAPSDWKEILDSQKLQWCCARHDLDTNENGEPKKVHTHIVCKFEGKKSYEQMLKITESVCGTIPQRVESMKGMIQYLWHRNNPEKYQYDKTIVECHGGFDIDDACSYTKTEVNKIKREIIQFLMENGILEYCDLVDYCALENDDWFDIVSTQTVFFKGYCDSRRYSVKGTENDKRR